MTFNTTPEAETRELPIVVISHDNTEIQAAIINRFGNPTSVKFKELPFEVFEKLQQKVIDEKFSFSNYMLLGMPEQNSYGMISPR